MGERQKVGIAERMVLGLVERAERNDEIGRMRSEAESSVKVELRQWISWGGFALRWRVAVNSFFSLAYSLNLNKLSKQPSVVGRVSIFFFFEGRYSSSHGELDD